MDKYKNKFRIQSARAKWWDYQCNGAYFITICTQNREHFFGEINNGKIKLSPTGVIANILWHEIPNHSQFVELGDFVVMPNHIHGVLILVKQDTDNSGRNDGPNDVETLHTTSLQKTTTSKSSQFHQPKNEQMAEISPKSNSVSTIIRSYKSAVTKHANRLGFENGWQSLFHDHIIRNDKEFRKISEYIINNQTNWADDKFFTK